MKEAGSIIALLCVSWLTCSTALVHKRTQTKVNASSSVAGQQSWSPQVHAYIRHLEDIENGISLVESQKQNSVTGVSGSGPRPDAKDNAIPQHPGSGTVLFIVLSDSYHYNSNLRYISETWGKDLPASQLMAIGDGDETIYTYGQDNSLVGGMQVQKTQCPAHSHDGACCKMGEALINAQRVLKGSPHLKWAYISDDDAYVRPAAVEERFEHVDTRGIWSMDTSDLPGVFGAIIGIGSCRAGTCQTGGMCGGAGVGLSRQALQTLVGDSPSTFLKKHMQTCDRCALYGDVAIGQQAYEGGIFLTRVEGLNGWGMNKTAFDAGLSAPEEPLIYHPQTTEAQFLFLHKLFSPSGNTQTNSSLNLAAKRLESQIILDGSQEYQDKCATFKGNTQCWSDKLPAGDHVFPHGPPWLVG